MVRRVGVTLCLLALVAGMASAATTSRLKGEVYDNDGLAMPGVTIQISSDKLIGGPQVAIADGNGGFVFNLLPVGIYTVEATLVGFQPSSGQVQVKLGRTAEIIFNMVPETFGDTIEVTAQVPVVDTAQVNTSVTFDEDYLQKAAIGANGRDYLSMISQAAGVAGGGNASVMGGTQGDNSYLIDGLNTTDPALGTFGTNFNYDAIQEMNFQTGGFEAEFGQATGGIVNLVTKSGGNDFSGSFDVRFRNEQMTENGDHYDRDSQDSLYQSLSGTLGGPILRDKLWFFASLENVDTSYQNQGVDFPREYDGWNYIGKITWQISDSNRAVLKYSGDPADVTLWSDRFTDISARGNQYQNSDVWQAEINSVLSESVLLNASVGSVLGKLNSGPDNGDEDTSGHIYLVAGEDPRYYHNYPYSSLNDRDRAEIRVNTTIFVDEFAGSHEFKVGAEYVDMSWDNTFFYNGGAEIYDLSDRYPDDGYEYQDTNGDGYFNQYLRRKEPLENVRNPTTSEGNIATFFAQDAWRPHPNLTVKPGIRYDNTKLSNHTGEQIADMEVWQPRIGFAWDISGSSKYVLRGSFGRFMDPTALSIPNFASGVVESYHYYNLLEDLCNNTRGIFCDPESLPPAYDPIYWTNSEGIEYVMFDNYTGGVTTYEPAQTLDQAGLGHLEAPYADEFILAFETQVARDTSLELTYVNKKTKRIIEDTCANNTWVWDGGDYPDYDDSSTWTELGGCEYFVIANLESYFRDYEAVIFQAETRRERLHLLGSYTYSESYGNTPNGARESYAGSDADVFAVDFYNREGYMGDHREHRVKLNGYYLFPHNWTVGFDGYFSSAGHQTIFASCQNLNDPTIEDPAVFEEYGINRDEALTYCYSGDGVMLDGNDLFLTTRGEYETKSTWQLDLQGSKTWNFNKFDMTAVLTIYNVFDRELDRTFNTEALVGTEVGAPTSYLLPRRYEVGFRIEF